MIEQSAEQATIEKKRAADWTRQPIGVVVGWVLPIVLGNSIVLLPTSLRTLTVASFVWAVCFVWMGVACLLNARRCHRLHCYFSGPIFLGGALLTVLLGLGVISFGGEGLTELVWSTLGLALLTFVPELIRGRYARR